MGLLVLGHSKTPIAVDQVFARCGCCEKDTWSDLMVESVYFHIYWLPLFPFDKVANLICEECGNKRYGVAFNAKVVPNYEEIKGKFRHPLRTYLALAIVTGLILLAIIVSKINHHS